MTVNVVVTVKDRPEHTRQCLESLNAHTKPGGINLTVVDDQSDMMLFRWLNEQLNPHAAHLVRTKETLGVGGAKNYGVKLAEEKWGRGDFLYLSDNDAFFLPGWLETLTKAMESVEGPTFGVRLLGGCNHPYHRPEKFRLPSNPAPVPMYLTSNEFDGSVLIYGALAGTSWLMRWETWDKYGLLPDNARGTGQSEDTEFCRRITKDGCRVGATHPRVVIDCGKTDTFGKQVVGSEHYMPVEGVMIR